MDLREKGRKGIFDGEAAQLGYALNKMCYSFNNAAAREEFFADEMAYCDKFGLNEAQKTAIRTRDKSDFVMAGGSLYYFGKFIRLMPGANGVYNYGSNLKQAGG